MRKAVVLGFGALLVIAATSVAAVNGDYVEVRSADIFTGPCFANSQVGLEGQQAILAWHVAKGSWQGVSLDGLNVIAVVEAKSTLGDPYHSPYPARAVLIVDQRATAAERTALAGLVRSEAGELVGHVVRVEAALIDMAFGQGDQHGTVSLRAGSLVSIRTRSLCSGDHLCGNEEVYYPPLVKMSHSMPAYTLEDAFHGTGLGDGWTRADTRSAFVGSFSL